MQNSWSGRPSLLLFLVVGLQNTALDKVKDNCLTGMQARLYNSYISVLKTKKPKPTNFPRLVLPGMFQLDW